VLALALFLTSDMIIKINANIAQRGAGRGRGWFWKGKSGLVFIFTPVYKHKTTNIGNRDRDSRKANFDSASTHTIKFPV